MAVVYALAGWLALRLAIPPGYATAVWPAAGLALAAALLRGPRVLPGVALGSASVNVWTAIENGQSSRAALVVTGMIGLGASLQAFVGSRLVRRFVGRDDPLVDERSVGRFLLLAGPVACTVSASFGVTTLAVAGGMPWADFGISWVTWWVGDAIGAMIFGPLALVWAARPRAKWRTRQASVSIPLGLTFALVTVFFVRTSAWEQSRLRTEFTRRADVLADRVRSALGGYEDVVHAVAAFVSSAPELDQDRLSRFARPLLERNPGIDAVSFDARVAAAERDSFERSSNLRITEWRGGGQVAPAGRRDEHVVVRYIEPVRGNGPAVGFDVASDPVRARALGRARDEAAALATDFVTLVQDAEREPAFLYFVPVYRTGAPPAGVPRRRATLAGYAAGVFRLRPMVHSVVGRSAWRDVSLAIVDRTDGARRGIFSSSEDPPRTGPTPVVRSVELGGRRWDLELRPAGSSLVQRSWAAWTILVGGLLVTSLLGAFLLVVTGRSVLVAGLVGERTAALRGREAQLAEAEAIANLGSWSWDLVSDRVVWSEELSRIHGTRPGACTSLIQWMDRVHPQDREAVSDALEATRSGGGPFEVSYRVVRPDGETRYVEGRGRLVAAEDGASPKLIGTARDVSEVRSLETRVALADRLASLGTLAGGVAHEINNPLAYVLTNLDVVAEQIREKAGAEPDLDTRDLLAAVDDARDGADRVRRIVADLRIFAREDGGAVGPIDVRMVLDRTAAMAGNEIRHRARLVKDYAEVPAVHGSEPKLAQLFLNLLVNAAQAIPEGHAEENEIRLRCAPHPDGRVLVEVQDTGRGMPADVAARAFDPFFTTKGVGAGMGLGLSICHGIVRSLGGEIGLQSTPGSGTTLRVLLPASDASPRRSSAPPPKLPESPRGRILVIDDDPDVGRSMERLLRREHAVTFVSSAEEALDRIDKDGAWDVILCDVMMPAMTGEEFYSRLGATRPELAARVVFMTGGAFTTAAREFLSRVSNPWLEKPATADEIRRAVRKMLETPTAPSVARAAR